MLRNSKTKNILLKILEIDGYQSIFLWTYKLVLPNINVYYT